MMTEEKHYQDLLDMGQDFTAEASSTVGDFLTLKWLLCSPEKHRRQTVNSLMGYTETFGLSLEVLFWATKGF